MGFWDKCVSLRWNTRTTAKTIELVKDSLLTALAFLKPITWPALSLQHQTNVSIQSLWDKGFSHRHNNLFKKVVSLWASRGLVICDK